MGFIDRYGWINYGARNGVLAGRHSHSYRSSLMIIPSSQGDSEAVSGKPRARCSLMAVSMNGLDLCMSHMRANFVCMRMTVAPAMMGGRGGAGEQAQADKREGRYRFHGDFQDEVSCCRNLAASTGCT
jgi:hypothetical protein